MFLHSQGTHITQFVFNVQGLKEIEVAAGSGRPPQFDEDGDLVLPRSYRYESNMVLQIGINDADICVMISLSLSLNESHSC